MSRARRALVWGLLAGTLALPACVTRGTHQEVVAERDRLATEVKALRERVRLLEASNTSLESERVRLLEELESLREERETLERDVRALRRERAELVQSLEEREEALARLAKLKETYESLVSELESEVAEGQIQISQLREGLLLNLSDAILFPSGSAELTAQGRDVLRRVAARLRDTRHTVEVQGHTDNVPIRGALARRYPTNWELACARATSVVRLLEGAGVDPGRMRAVSYGEHRPVAPNDTPENRARNRRIEIRLIPVTEPVGEQGEGPPPAAPPAEAGGTPR